ncbi:pyrrolo-quinoline quinone [Natronococcus pandeyae]|uniref:Pyrrolo-quinoline quinone n=1 Tax=Natronococcus pandeyae TaxID=2055836 RepID=A0A8J8TSL8_9EURY|nr:PQQ-binding-like beta-propeller repeat protein [Natronococcus pandeyae]TYL39205.1 pyrrolo-quinoline quinone [Natronococcus pandeyae]
MQSSRRALLASVGSGAVLLPGCSRFSSTQSRDPPEPDEPPESGVDELPDPNSHVHGANGEWSSFGCNAANTRAVADGKAPVDGVSERWRVEVTPMVRREPVAAGGRVYLLNGSELFVFDADDGTEFWSVEDVWEPPLIREGVVYVSTYDGVHALEADTGDELWVRAIDVPGNSTVPATIGGLLICAFGERVVALDPEDGSVRWHRDVFGQVLDHAVTLGQRLIIVATEAGMVYALATNGVAYNRWQLPESPTAPPSIDGETIYVNCKDGNTYALTDENESTTEFEWVADTGWVDGGLAVVDDLVLAARGETLRALDAESGLRYWDHEIGDRDDTAPAYGRETVFVGGDRLRALDPAPEGNPADGPAIRFEHEFGGEIVGPGPVLNDGTLYVVAEVEDEEVALLALE